MELAAKKRGDSVDCPQFLPSSLTDRQKRLSVGGQLLIDNPQQTRQLDLLSKRTEALLNTKTGALWLRRAYNLLDLCPEQAKALPDDIMRRLRVLQGSTTRKIDQQYSRLLAAVFPRFANALLARAPKYPPQLVGAPDRARPLHTAPLA